MRASRTAAGVLGCVVAVHLTGCTSDAPAETPGASAPGASASTGTERPVPLSGGVAGSVRGRVLVSGGPAVSPGLGARPVAGARVQLVSLATGDVVASATTDAAGRYTLGTRAAHYRLVAPDGFSGCSLTGRAAGSSTVVLAPSRVVTQDISCAIR